MEGGRNEEGPNIYEVTTMGHYAYIVSHNLILPNFHKDLRIRFPVDKAIAQRS